MDLLANVSYVIRVSLTEQTALNKFHIDKSTSVLFIIALSLARH